MKKVRTLIVDDEPLARSRIRNLLNRSEAVEIVGEAKNGQEAMKMLTDYRPDLMFLDIQMPDLDGFELLENTSIDSLPFIIFVTAYDQYALKAFDVHAVDYLLKPFDDERFFRSLDHARQQISLKEDALLHHKMVSLIQSHQQGKGGSTSHLEIREQGVSHHISIEDIHFVEAHGNYLKIYTARGKYLLRQTMQSLEDEIDQAYFLRIHRSYLVNCHYVNRIRYQGNNQYLFRMRNGEELVSSRGHKEDIEDFLQDESLRRKLENPS